LLSGIKIAALTGTSRHCALYARNNPEPPPRARTERRLAINARIRQHMADHPKDQAPAIIGALGVTHHDLRMESLMRRAQETP
jgi:hypothetical protein